MIFTVEQESEIETYLKTAASIFFGLTPLDVRKLSYEYALTLTIDVPESWRYSKIAGVDWFYGFLKRHPGLSIRQPEATSLARATSFNQHNVENFYIKLAEVITRYKLETQDIWNIDETGVTTVQKPRCIVASKGTKQVGALTSEERGQLVTLCVAISATGNTVPPMFIFLRKHFKDHFIRDGPPGCSGAVTPSGWIQAEEFLQFMKRFVRNTRAAEDHPLLVLLDNHHSHLDMNVLNFAKATTLCFYHFRHIAPIKCSHLMCRYSDP